MAQTVVAIGTRKGLWLARSDDRRDWSVEGPHFLMSEVAAVTFDTRRGRPRILAGVMSWHWGPTVQVSDDGGMVSRPVGTFRSLGGSSGLGGHQRRADGRSFAHRTLPCGSSLVLELLWNGGK